jgi:hypothetical protein
MKNQSQLQQDTIREVPLNKLNKNININNNVPKYLRYLSSLPFYKDYEPDFIKRFVKFNLAADDSPLAQPGGELIGYTVAFIASISMIDPGLYGDEYESQPSSLVSESDSESMDDFEVGQGVDIDEDIATSLFAQSTIPESYARKLDSLNVLGRVQKGRHLVDEINYHSTGIKTRLAKWVQEIRTEDWCQCVDYILESNEGINESATIDINEIKSAEGNARSDFFESQVEKLPLQSCYIAQSYAASLAKSLYNDYSAGLLSLDMNIIKDFFNSEDYSKLLPYLNSKVDALFLDPHRSYLASTKAENSTKHQNLELQETQESKLKDIISSNNHSQCDLAYDLGRIQSVILYSDNEILNRAACKINLYQEVSLVRDCNTTRVDDIAQSSQNQKNKQRLPTNMVPNVNMEFDLFNSIRNTVLHKENLMNSLRCQLFCQQDGAYSNNDSHCSLSRFNLIERSNIRYKRSIDYINCQDADRSSRNSEADTKRQENLNSRSF